MKLQFLCFLALLWPSYIIVQGATEIPQFKNRCFACFISSQNPGGTWGSNSFCTNDSFLPDNGTCYSGVVNCTALGWKNPLVSDNFIPCMPIDKSCSVGINNFFDATITTLTLKTYSEYLTMLPNNACVRTFTNNLTVPITFTISNAGSDISPFIKKWPSDIWASAKTNPSSGMSVNDTYTAPNTGSQIVAPG